MKTFILVFYLLHSHVLGLYVAPSLEDCQLEEVKIQRIITNDEVRSVCFPGTKIQVNMDDFIQGR